MTFGEVRRLSTYSDGFDSRTRYQTSKNSCKKKTPRPEPHRAVCQLRNGRVRVPRRGTNLCRRSHLGYGSGLSIRVRRVRFPSAAPILCSGGREAQCNSLQNCKTVGSNPTRYSKIYTRVTQWTRVLRYERRSRRFESFRGCHYKSTQRLKTSADVAETASPCGVVGRFDSCECTFIMGTVVGYGVALQAS